MTIEVQRNDDRSRYELLVDDEVAGVADFRVDGDVVVLPHTEVHPSLRGRGLGAQLVRAALDDVRGSGRLVAPLCWYVREFIDQHDDYADLVG